MYRRRRNPREKIAFSFDSFLDVVTNVVGIIIRLILVAWVGGRSYSALMRWTEAQPVPAPHAKAAPQPQDDPLSEEIRKTQQELDAARDRLQAQLQGLGKVQQDKQTLQARLASLNQERQRLETQRQELDRTGSQKDQLTRLAALSMEELRRRQQSLFDDLKKLEALPAPKKELRYRTPVSRAVQADEVFFECQGERITFIDLPAFLQEIQGGLEGRVEQLRTSWKVDEATRTVGAFRLRYAIEREPETVEALGGGAKPGNERSFRYGLTGWVVEPVAPLRGETTAAALAPNSDFRRLVDGLDSTTVVTIWVYPDSFAAFRQLRDYLYERGLEVAGRPLPPGAPIAASRHGSASRGQ